jgi:hypothetical protein
MADGFHEGPDFAAVLVKVNVPAGYVLEAMPPRP